MTTQLDRLSRDVGELLESHERTRSRRDFSGYADRPVDFFREVLHWEPWWRQVEIAGSVAGNRWTVVRSAQSIGKDAVAGALALWWIFARGGLCIVSSATERQVIGQTMREVRDRFRSATDLPGQLFVSAFRLDGEDRILAFTSGNVDNLTGWHDPRGVLVILSEGQGERIEDVGYDAAIACAADERSRILALGNPVRPSGRFYEINQRPTWNAIRIPAFDHPNVAEGRVVIPGGPSPDWPGEVEREYGADSPYYVGRVLAEFPATAIDGLISRAWLERAAERWVEERDDQARSLHLMKKPPVLGVDVARLGGDQTIVGVARGHRLLSLHALPAADLMTTCGRIVAHAREAGLLTRSEAGAQPHGRIVVDSIGVGAGVADRLQEIGYKVLEVNVSEKAIEEKRYLNRRAEAAWTARKKLEAGELALPRDPDLWEDLLAYRWFPTSAGKIQLESKEVMRTRLHGRSPDRGDVVFLIFGLARHTASSFHFELA